ncbi:MAG: uroporphyrinogen decarboxylase family protein [Anaerolineae bacterium]
MTAKERVLAALAFEKTDRFPIYNTFWGEFEEIWRRQKGLGPDVNIYDYYGIDLVYIAPDETPFPSRKQTLAETPERTIARDGWGAVTETRQGAKFFETVAVALPDKAGLDRLEFESPQLDGRFPAHEEVRQLEGKRCVFVKTGGPYLRTSNLRGSEQWLIDLAEDSQFAHELAMRVTDHMTAVGLEAIRRFNLYDTGVWFYDDMACNRGPMFSPATFERVFLPCYSKMCRAYREAGVRHILLHSDGNIEPILDMLIDAGIEGINPIEPKAGMDVVKLRQRYGRKLALLGGLDNAHILAQGTAAEIEAHVRHVMSAGAEGGLVVAAHSIGPDMPVANYELVHKIVHGG